MTQKITRNQFKTLVNKAGSTQKAAAIMGVKVAAVSAHLRGRTSLSLARLRKLQRAVDDGYTVKDVKPPVHQDHVVMTPEELATVRRYRASECEEGWQRDLNETRVAQIEDQIRNKTAKLPPIMLGRLPDDTLVEIDGQHRSEGHISANVACLAVIYDIADIEEARQLFLAYGGRVVPISTKVRYVASRNNLKQTLEAWELQFNADQEHVCALARGLIGSKNVDFVNPDGFMNKSQRRRGKAILTVWTNNVRWTSKRKGKKDTKKAKKKGDQKPSLYSSPKMLQALGKLCQDYGDDTMIGLALDIVQNYHKAFTGSWYRTAKDHGQKALVHALRAYVTPRLLGGKDSKQKTG